MAKEYFTAEQCAARLGCNQSTVHRWMKKKMIRVTPIAGKQLIREDHCVRPAEKLDGRGSALFGRKKGTA